MSDEVRVSPETRRDFIRKVTTSGAAAAAVLGGMGMDPFMAAAMAQEMGRSEKPLRAAFVRGAKDRALRRALNGA
jgi:ribose transport system substrate-binding protein